MQPSPILYAIGKHLRILVTVIIAYYDEKANGFFLPPPVEISRKSDAQICRRPAE